MLCYVDILQAKFKLYYRNYFYIIFRICHRAIFCTLILSPGCLLGGLPLGGVGLRWPAGVKRLVLFAQISSESGTVLMSLLFPWKAPFVFCSWILVLHFSS